MKQVITNKQGICLVLLFMSDALVFGTAKDAKTDIWIAVILGVAIGLILALLYSWIIVSYPGMNLYDILQVIYGKWLGNLIILIYTLYALYVGSLALIAFTLFTSIVGLVDTPQIVVASVMTLLVVSSMKKGIETMGRWSEFFAKILIPVTVLTVFFMLPMIEANNLKPVLADGFGPVVQGAYGLVAFPFAEIVIFMLILSTKSIRQSKKGIVQIFVYGLLIGGLLMFITHVAAFVELGEFAYTSSYFPIYAAISRISIHDIFQRIEIVIAVGFIMGGFIKVAIYVLAGSNGICKLANIKDCRLLLTPIGIIVLISALTTFHGAGILDLEEHIPYYNILAIFMQTVVPIIIGATIFIRRKLLHLDQQPLEGVDG